MADVLMINMWTSDIGRHDASNYGIFKVIFEVNLKLFEQSSMKKLLFVLRDYDEQIEFDRIKERINRDLATIWSEIHKAERFANSRHDEFFDIEFFVMPHKVYREL